MSKLKLLVIAFVILALPGCTAWNWDTQHKEARSQGPGATAEGASAHVCYGPNNKIHASAEEWVDGYGRKRPGKAEVRKGSLVWAEAWGSDFDFLHIGPQKKMEIEAAADGSGKAIASGSQEPHGWTLQEILLAIGAIIVLPLIVGGALVIIPATRPIGSAILSVYGKVFGFILGWFKKGKEKDNG